MRTAMPTYDRTNTWQRALAAKVDDPNSKERERLRVAFEAVRSRAIPLGEAIAKDLPDYTIHDVTHSDALWEYADLITGLNYELTPCEAFVLGCAFLVHDLGMGLASYPDGHTGIKDLPQWRDTVAGLLRKAGMDEVADTDIDTIDSTVEALAIGDMLRRLHAERAETLAMVSWKGTEPNQFFHLIEDADLRNAFGPIIGKIAYSHWWSVDVVAKQFINVMGAQVGFPPSWTIDPLKLACILRCADYAHVDERRAPPFLLALNRPSGESEAHWKFQGKLYQPRLEGDRLVFTAKSGFGVSDAAAWWTCFDSLAAIDLELRKVDSLLADTRRNRFAARGVSQVDEASRLSKLIQTDGWRPVDAKIRVSAVAEVVGRLGGQELYGDILTPPLRELIQNAADAVRARRLIDKRGADWGEIRVTTGNDSDGVWIQVEDTGIGMSETVLTGPLLDFGTSFWNTSLMQEQLPGLASRGFQPTGRYGIGFFSLFMWGGRVHVTSQRFDMGRSETLTLMFNKGLKERPILRLAKTDEHIPDGGTRVKVWFSNADDFTRLTSEEGTPKLSMAQLCARLAPTLDVTIRVDGEIAVTANDWLNISDEALLMRISPPSHYRLRKTTQRDDNLQQGPLSILYSSKGRPMGRARITVARINYWNSRGILSVGGFAACGLSGIGGILVGVSDRATRDAATPTICPIAFNEWANAQRQELLKKGYDPEILYNLTQTFAALGLDLSGMPIARANSGWVTPEQISKIASTLDEILFIDDLSYGIVGERISELTLKNGVFSMESGVRPIGQSAFDQQETWPPFDGKEKWGKHEFFSRSPQGKIIESIAEGWNSSLTDVLNASTLDSDEEDEDETIRDVGQFAGKPYLLPAIVFKRPK